MSDPRIPLKNRFLAGLLGFLFPGAGHLYQGRLFKAVVYSICILALFLTGMVMADWKAIQPPGKFGMKGTPLYFDDGRGNDAGSGIRTLKFVAQGSLGIPTIVSITQNRRYGHASHAPVTELKSPLDTSFHGFVNLKTGTGNKEGYASGTVHLEPAAGEFGRSQIGGTFSGTLEGEPIELTLESNVELGPELGADRFRGLQATLRDTEGNHCGEIQGGIPRAFLNRFMMTMNPDEENELQTQLGKRHELAMVLTWIAGLLNILAIWDAVEGPAYGFGDEEEHPETDSQGTTPTGTGS